MRLPLPLVMLAVGGLACGATAPAPATPMAAAGDHHDDGDGFLSRVSTSLVTAPDGPDGEDGEDADGAELAADDEVASAGDSDDVFGGDAYGGAIDGAASAPDAWGGSAAEPQMFYQPQAGLIGALAGTVTWSGAAPARLATACGAMDNLVRVGADRGVGGALVFIEKLTTGRPRPTYAKAATIGGVIAKHGCALLPAAQIVAPLPATLSIEGDATAAPLHATAPSGVTRALVLEEGGRVRLDALDGVVRIDSDDRTVAPAWVIGLDSPAYAITDDGGRFRIDQLAPGTYDVAIWSPPVATAGPDHRLAYGAPILVHRRVTLAAATRTTRLDVTLR